jgi:hypothetical protein
VDPMTCVNTCMSGWFCPQSWPQSCTCKNNLKKKCAAQCGTPVSGLQDCTP